MSFFTRLIGFSVLLCGLVLGFRVSAQSAPDTPPARVVLVFKTAPSAFSSLLLDDIPFAKLTFPEEQASVWSAPSGTRTIGVRAADALPKDVKIELRPGQTYLLTLWLADLPGSPAPGQPSKEVKLVAAQLPLPAPDSQVRGFVYLPSGEQPLSAELVSGSSRDAKSTPITVPPAKLTPIGTGRFSLLVKGKPLVFLNSSTPGLYVYLLFPDKEGHLKPRPFVVFSGSAASPAPSAPRQ
jgi:hypothetical protein